MWCYILLRLRIKGIFWVIFCVKKWVGKCFPLILIFDATFHIKGLPGFLRNSFSCRLTAMTALMNMKINPGLICLWSFKILFTLRRKPEIWIVFFTWSRYQSYIFRKGQKVSSKSPNSLLVTLVFNKKVKIILKITILMHIWILSCRRTSK